LGKLGALDDARPLAEEAWGSSPDGSQEKAAAAFVLAQAAPSAADEVVWLERCEQSPQIRALLAGSRARAAPEEGRLADARAAADEALALQGGQGATLRAVRFGASGERKDLDASIAELESSVAAKDAPPVLVENLADSLLMRAVLDTVKDRIR